MSEERAGKGGKEAGGFVNASSCSLSGQNWTQSRSLKNRVAMPVQVAGRVTVTGMYVGRCRGDQPTPCIPTEHQYQPHPGAVTGGVGLYEVVGHCWAGGVDPDSSEGETVLGEPPGADLVLFSRLGHLLGRHFPSMGCWGPPRGAWSVRVCSSLSLFTVTGHESWLLGGGFLSSLPPPAFQQRLLRDPPGFSCRMCCWSGGAGRQRPIASCPKQRNELRQRPWRRQSSLKSYKCFFRKRDVARPAWRRGRALTCEPGGPGSRP